MVKYTHFTFFSRLLNIKITMEKSRKVSSCSVDSGALLGISIIWWKSMWLCHGPYLLLAMGFSPFHTLFSSLYFWFTEPTEMKRNAIKNMAKVMKTTVNKCLTKSFLTSFSRIIFKEASLKKWFICCCCCLKLIWHLLWTVLHVQRIKIWLCKDLTHLVLSMVVEILEEAKKIANWILPIWSWITQELLPVLQSSSVRVYNSFQVFVFEEKLCEMAIIFCAMQQ